MQIKHNNTMQNEILELRNKTQQLISNDRKMKEALPKYEDLLPEIATQRKNKFLSDVTEATKTELERIKFETSLKADKIRTEINKAKYKLENAVFPDELQIQTVKLRAENLARQKLDSNILIYLDKAFQSNETDFLYSFLDAVKLNTDVSNDLRIDINNKFSDYEKKTGVYKMNLELQLTEKFSQQIDSYIKIAEDPNPDNKLMLIYSDQEIKNLEDQINNL